MIALSNEQLEIIRKSSGFTSETWGAKVYLYGSRAKGTSWKYSDVDLAIDAPHPIDLLLADRIRNTLTEAGIPYRIDITDLNADLSPIFRENIERCKKILFDGKYLLIHLPHNFENEVLKEAQLRGLRPQELVEQFIENHYPGN
jgi:predicted nucleotidyltransferase